MSKFLAGLNPEAVRIAALEAELAKSRASHAEAFQLGAEAVTRAEKAEAEVERLKASQRLDGERILFLVAHDINHGCNPEQNWRRERGGRESGGTKSLARVGPVSTAGPGTAAAEHAAHALCWDEPCSECQAEEDAARKERDDG